MRRRSHASRPLARLKAIIMGLVVAGCAGPPLGGRAPAAGATATPAAPAASIGMPFEDVTGAVGLDFTHVSGAAGDLTLLEMMGSGVAVFDYDNDGDLDVYLVQGHALPRVVDATAPIPQPPADAPLDRLFRNDLALRPDGSAALAFTDVTASSGLRAAGYGMGVATGDYDNDGQVDLYVTNWGPNQLWRNNGDGTFADVTAAAGVDDPAWSTSAGFLDYDRDGWLDLVVVNYVDFTLATHRPCVSQTAGRIDYCGPRSYVAVPARLFHNRGDGTFEDVTAGAGLTAASGPGLGVIAADVDRDGWPDIYVANDTQENLLWMNDGGRRFTNEARLRGAAVNASGMPEAGMGVVAEDLTGDGFDDLFITHIFRETNTLFVADGAGYFQDRTRGSGLGMPSWRFTGFGVAAPDYDQDGRPDLFTTNGAVNIILEQLQAGEDLPLKQTNQLYRNLGGGRFEDVSASAGPPFAAPLIGRGLAAGDLDNDGDTDVVVTENDGPAHVYRNVATRATPWLGLRLVAGDPPRDQIGGRVELVGIDGPPRTGRVHTDGSYLSASDPRLLFAWGEGSGFDVVRVTWPTGEVEEWHGLDSRRYHTLAKGTGTRLDPP